MLVPVQDAQVVEAVEIDADLERVIALEQRHIVLDLEHVAIGQRSGVAASSGRDRREIEARFEDVDVREVPRVVQAAGPAPHVGEIVHVVHLRRDLVQAVVPEHPVVLTDGAVRVDGEVVGLAVVIVQGPRHRVAPFVLARIAEHQRVRVVELRGAFERIGQEAAGLLPMRG